MVSLSDSHKRFISQILIQDPKTTADAIKSKDYAELKSLKKSQILSAIKKFFQANPSVAKMGLPNGSDDEEEDMMAGPSVRDSAANIAKRPRTSLASTRSNNAEQVGAPVVNGPPRLPGVLQKEPSKSATAEQRQREFYEAQSLSCLRAHPNYIQNNAAVWLKLFGFIITYDELDKFTVYMRKWHNRSVSWNLNRLFPDKINITLEVGETPLDSLLEWTNAVRSVHCRSTQYDPSANDEVNLINLWLYPPKELKIIKDAIRVGKVKDRRGQTMWDIITFEYAQEVEILDRQVRLGSSSP